MLSNEGAANPTPTFYVQADFAAYKLRMNRLVGLTAAAAFHLASHSHPFTCFTFDASLSVPSQLDFRELS